MKFKNWVVRVAAAMCALGLVPEALGQKGIHMTGWEYNFCIYCATLGPIIIGISAKAKDEHSTIDQVQKSSLIVPAPNATVVASYKKPQ